jgi:predicted Ser/Thr protein kinase
LLSDEDIQLVLEARRLDYLTAGAASACLEQIVEGLRSGKPVRVVDVLRDIGMLTEAQLAILKNGPPRPPAKSPPAPASPRAVSRPTAPVPPPMPSSALAAGKGPAIKSDQIHLLLQARQRGFLSPLEANRCLLLAIDAERGGTPFDLQATLKRKHLLTPAQLAELTGESRPRPRPAKKVFLSDSEEATLPFGVGDRLGEYTLVAQLGRGGIGVIYEATRRGTMGERLALKVFAPSSGKGSRKLLKRFRHEASLAGALDHPNIVKVHEISRDRGFDFIVMDFVAGRSLAELLEAGKVPVAQAVQVIMTAARAAQHMHERFVVHRDLKPANLMVRPDGDVCVIDFGLAKDFARHQSFRQSWSGSRGWLGTPAYMAPEQARCEFDAISPSTDVFALGATLYRAVVGRWHFDADSPMEALWKISTGRWWPVRELREEVPQRLAYVIDRAMAFDPRTRPSALEVAHALENVARGDLSLPPCPPSLDV